MGDRIYFSNLPVRHLSCVVCGVTLHPFRWELSAHCWGSAGFYLGIGPVSVWADWPYSWD